MSVRQAKRSLAIEGSWAGGDHRARRFRTMDGRAKTIDPNGPDQWGPIGVPMIGRRSCVAIPEFYASRFGLRRSQGPKNCGHLFPRPRHLPRILANTRGLERNVAVASMRPGQFYPGYQAVHVLVGHPRAASMRPEQFCPGYVLHDITALGPLNVSFNEAETQMPCILVAYHAWVPGCHRINAAGERTNRIRPGYTLKIDNYGICTTGLQ